MKLQIRTFTSLAVLAVILVVTTAAYAQQATQVKLNQSAEATLHILIADRGPSAASRMPEGMEAIRDQIRRRFGSDNLTLLDSYFGRMAVGGTGEFKSSIKFQQGGGNINQGFVDWRLVGLSAAEPNVFSARNFRFSFRAGVTMRPDDDQTKPPGPLLYEPVIVSLNELSIAENTPHLLGTTNMPDGVGKLFLVLTITHVR